MSISSNIQQMRLTTHLRVSTQQHVPFVEMTKTQLAESTDTLIYQKPFQNEHRQTLYIHMHCLFTFVCYDRCTIFLRITICRRNGRTMYIKQVHIHEMNMNLKHPFATSFGTMQEKHFYIIEVVDELGNTGYGESVAFTEPWYTEETAKTNEYIIREFLIDLLRDKNISHPDEVTDIFSPIRRNNMAKAAIEGAIWDAYAKRNQQTLAEALGGTKTTIDV